jgi:hypothetical protein
MEIANSETHAINAPTDARVDGLIFLPPKVLDTHLFFCAARAAFAHIPMFHKIE